MRLHCLGVDVGHNLIGHQHHDHVAPTPPPLPGVTTANPASSAEDLLDEPPRSPTLTLTPESERLRAWAWPWLP